MTMMTPNVKQRLLKIDIYLQGEEKRSLLSQNPLGTRHTPTYRSTDEDFHRERETQ